MARDILGSDTPQTRAARSGGIWEGIQRARDRVIDEFETVDDPRDVPIRQRDGGLGPAQSFLDFARPLEAAHQLDPQFPRQDLGRGDVERADDGFRPTETVRRRSAAFDFEEDTPLEDVDPQQDVVPQDDGFGLAEPRQRDIAAMELDPQFPLVDLGREDVERAGDGFGLTGTAEREIAAERIEEDTPLDEVAPGDVRRSGDGFELRRSVIEENIDLFR